MSSSFMQVTPKVFQLKQTPYNIEQNKGEQYKITKDQVNFRSSSKVKQQMPSHQIKLRHI